MGVLALPFHFVMPLSGLIIFFSIFFSGTWQAVYAGDRAAFNRDTFGIYQRPKADQNVQAGQQRTALRRRAVSGLRAAAPLWGTKPLRGDRRNPPPEPPPLSRARSPG